MNLTCKMYKQLVYTTRLNYNEIVKFAFVWTISYVENSQDVMILTVSNFAKSRTMHSTN